LRACEAEAEYTGLADEFRGVDEVAEAVVRLVDF
jgi:hypothetical protein